MSVFVIEYLGFSGVKSTPISLRLDRPKSGDVIEFPEELQRYPLTHGGKGRIQSVSDGRVHFCCEMGSAFLEEGGTVSISGGPFSSVPVVDIEPTMTLHPTRVWNWGDNSPGAAQGVSYTIDRPSFRLKRHPDDNPDDN